MVLFLFLDSLVRSVDQRFFLPSGYLLHSHGKIHPFVSSVNHLFLWVIYTMAMLVITRLGKNWSSFPLAGQVPDCAAAECGTSPGNAAESAALAAAAWPLGLALGVPPYWVRESPKV